MTFPKLFQIFLSFLSSIPPSDHLLAYHALLNGQNVKKDNPPINQLQEMNPFKANPFKPNPINDNPFKPNPINDNPFNQNPSQENPNTLNDNTGNEIDINSKRPANATVIQFNAEYTCDSQGYCITMVKYETAWYIEFFPGKFVTAYFITQTSPNLQERLQELDDNGPIAIDFEWQPGKQNNPIALIQLCSSKLCLIIRMVPQQDSPVLRSFLLSHSFFGKGCGNDKIKIRVTFGPQFIINLEDVEITQLYHFGLTANFDNMITSFAGIPTSSFKSKSVSRSNWGQPINLRQFFYAAFDVVGLYECYKNFPGVRRQRGLPPFEKGRQYFRKNSKKKEDKEPE